MVRVAVLYVAVGAYDVFWPEFHESAEQHLCPGHERHYFVFTDSPRIQAGERVHLVYQEPLGWPTTVLFRYRMFLRVAERLSGFDRVIFFNGNMVVLADIAWHELFPEDADLVAGIHPGFHDSPPDSFTYERRPESAACLPQGRRYLAGGLMGGAPAPFFSMCRQLADAVERDLDAGIVALWLDESHWNAFIAREESAGSLRFHFVDPGFLYPEGWQLPFTARILLREKSRYFDVDRFKSGPAAQPLPVTYPRGIWRRALGRLRRALPVI